jgi:serine/threonine protein kinase/tetratricopeptide (TPR) repeat protein
MTHDGRAGAGQTETELSAIKELFGAVIEARSRDGDQDSGRMLRAATPSVRSAVEALLAAHRRASGVLLDDTPRPGASATHGTVPGSDAGVPVPTVAGYEILRELGRGGFGIVYAARQRTPIDREVAIKVLRREFVGEDAIARFRAESVMLARMSHESIAKVYDAGLTDQGQPFVAMELIDALPLGEACAALGLTTRQRVALMARVCDAVQHAHQRAVIHRDLKPANILIESRGGEHRPRVIDFGIAKLLESDPGGPHTSAHVRLGTPRYMSPEQRTGKETGDVRVDVYAMGAMLCELLAGDVPTAGSSGGGDPGSGLTRPSKIAGERTGRTTTHPKSLRGDLDRIVLKACADDPELRYPSAQAMGDDLRRYLDGRPVSASPPSIVYLSRKFVRRHRASVSLAGLLGVALLGAMAVAALKWHEANVERDRARASTDRVAFIGDFMLEMLLLTADSNARGSAPILTGAAMQDIADRAAGGLADDPERMLPMLEGIGRFQTQSGYPELGTATVRRALDFAIDFYGVPSAEVIELRIRLHDLLWGHGMDGWKEQIALADEESAQLFGEEDPRRLRVLQRSQGTIENLERIISVYETLPDVDPSEMYHALFALGMQQRFGPTPGDQLETNRRLYELASSHFPPDHGYVIDSMSMYGDAMTAYAPSEATAELLNTAYARSIRVFGYDHFTTESIRRGLARIYGKLGRPEEGIPFALADLESVARGMGNESIQYANALAELGRLYQYAERFVEARSALERALSLKQDLWPPGHAQITSTQIVLGQVCHHLEDHAAAEQLCADAIRNLREPRHAMNFVSAMSVRISGRERTGDTSGADDLRAQTREHLAQLGMTPEQIRAMLE